MKTEEKIELLDEFMSQPENKMIGKKLEDETISASQYFDIEVSKTFKQIDFSLVIEMNNINEAVSVLKEVTTNMDESQIMERLTKLLEQSNLNPNSNFYMIAKGNRIEGG